LEKKFPIYETDYFLQNSDISPTYKKAILQCSILLTFSHDIMVEIIANQCGFPFYKNDKLDLSVLYVFIIYSTIKVTCGCIGVE
jgi:hypothetical protein